jgi:tetratricopeptide (TPR) repeat protein
MPFFTQAIAELKKSGTLQINELHFYAADTLARFERYEEAEREFIEELKYFPQNTRARGGLAMLYQASGRPEDAARVLADMLRITPTPDSYALAARLYTMFGDRKQAEIVRTEARHAFAKPRNTSPRNARN